MDPASAHGNAIAVFKPKNPWKRFKNIHNIYMKTKQSEARNALTYTHTYIHGEKEQNKWLCSEKICVKGTSQIIRKWERYRERETMWFVRITMNSAMFAFIVRFFSCPTKRRQKKMWGAYAPHKDTQTFLFTIHLRFTIFYGTCKSLCVNFVVSCKLLQTVAVHVLSAIHSPILWTTRTKPNSIKIVIIYLFQHEPINHCILFCRHENWQIENCAFRNEVNLRKGDSVRLDESEREKCVALVMNRPKKQYQTHAYGQNDDGDEQREKWRWWWRWCCNRGIAHARSM